MLIRFKINEEYELSLLVIHQKVYLTNNIEEEEVVKYELYKHREYFLYITYTFGYYKIEQNTINYWEMIKDTYIYGSISFFLFIKLRELIFIYTCAMDVVKRSPVMIERKQKKKN